ncbi:MAG: RBBP9/YdeN family alpha/beta hydrolase [Candidatus Nanohaloarchaea archaeon]
MSSKNVFLIHGFEGSPEDNWFPWLKDKLEEKGYEVIVPDFPTPEDQTLENWMDVFKEYEEELNRNSIVVGHSLGCPFILHLLQEGFEVEKAIFVAGFVGKIGDEYIDEVNEDIAGRKFDWDKIRGNAEEFILMHSTNDPYVDREKADELEEKLEAKLNIYEGYNHFNVSAGYTELPEILEFFS